MTLYELACMLIRKRDQLRLLRRAGYTVTNTDVTAVQELSYAYARARR